MGVRSHAAMDDVELWECALLQLEEFSDVFGIQPRRSFGLKLCLYSVHVVGRKAGWIDEMFLSQFVIALWIRGRHRAFIHPKQMDAAPIETSFRQFTEQQLGS